MDLILITGQKSVLGESSSVFQDTAIVDPTAPAAPVENYYFKNAGGVAFMGSNDPNGALSAAFAPYIEVLFPVTPNTVASFSKSNVSLGDLDGDGKNDTATLALTSKVEDFEALDTALGTLARTLRTTEAFSGTLTLSSNSSNVPISSMITTWSAPGIGVVKRTFSMTVQGQTQQAEFDIRGYVSDTAAQGLTTPYVIESNIAGNSPVFQAGQPVLGTDGTHFLAVENTPNGLTGTLFDGNAKVLATVNLGSGGSPGISFDGTNYVIAITSSSSLAADSPRDARRRGPGCPQRDYRESSRHADQLPRDLQRQRQLADRLFALRLGDQSALHVRRAHRPRGQVLGSGEFPIAVDLVTHWFPQVSFDGTNFLVVWQQLPSSGADQSLADIYGARVSCRRGGARLPHHRDLDRPPGAVFARHRL